MNLGVLKNSTAYKLVKTVDKEKTITYN